MRERERERVNYMRKICGVIFYLSTCLQRKVVYFTYQGVYIQFFFISN